MSAVVSTGLARAQAKPVGLTAAAAWRLRSRDA